MPQYLFLPSIIMYNIFAALGGFKDTLVLPSAYPFLLPLEILLRPLQAAAPYLGVLGYFGVLTGWVVAHNRCDRGAGEFT